MREVMKHQVSPLFPCVPKTRGQLLAMPVADNRIGTARPQAAYEVRGQHFADTEMVAVVVALCYDVGIQKRFFQKPFKQFGKREHNIRIISLDH